MTITPSEVLDRLSHPDNLDAAARMAAVDCFHRGASLAQFNPGDATHYIVSLIGPFAARSTIGPSTVAPDQWYVGTNLGASYPWNGTSLHYDYVAEKWTRGNLPSGIVLADFLTKVAEHYNALRSK